MDGEYDWDVNDDDFKPWNMRSHSPLGFESTHWTTADGRTIKITVMDQAHLENALAYCIRHERPRWYYQALEKEVARRKALEKSGKVEIRYCTYGE